MCTASCQCFFGAWTLQTKMQSNQNRSHVGSWYNMLSWCFFDFFLKQPKDTPLFQQKHTPLRNCSYSQKKKETTVLGKPRNIPAEFQWTSSAAGTTISMLFSAPWALCSRGRQFEPFDYPPWSPMATRWVGYVSQKKVPCLLDQWVAAVFQVFGRVLKAKQTAQVGCLDSVCVVKIFGKS